MPIEAASKIKKALHRRVCVCCLAIGRWCLLLAACSGNGQAWIGNCRQRKAYYDAVCLLLTVDFGMVALSHGQRSIQWTMVDRL